GDPESVTAPADRGPITPSVAATGTVNPVTTVQVGTYVSGPIQAIYADFNTPVRRGQLLARIDPRPFQVKVDDATAALANARAQLDKDRADAALRALTLGRTRALRGGGIVSASDLDLAVSQDRQARAQVALENADLRLKPGMTANVAITTASRADALRVPSGALRFRPPAVAGESGSAAAADGPGERGPRVWVLGADGQPRAVGVTTGIAD